jgi:hypothetical protein
MHIDNICNILFIFTLFELYIVSGFKYFIHK